MKASNMIMFVVGLVLSLIIIAQLLPLGLAPILDIANVNVTNYGAGVNDSSLIPFGDIPGAGSLIPLITLIGIISVIAIIIKIVSSAISGQD